MRVLNLTVPLQPMLALVGAAQRVDERREAGRAWCVTWLPVLRARAGLTQNQLADALGVNRLTYRAAELGEVVPTRETAEKILTWLSDQRSES